MLLKAIRRRNVSLLQHSGLLKSSLSTSPSSAVFHRRLPGQEQKSSSSVLPPFLAVCSDMDGVLWYGPTDPIQNSIAALHALKSSGRPIVFVTNSSTKSRESIAAKLDSMGYPTSPEEVVTSSYVTAQHMKKTLQFSSSKTVFMIGNEVLQTELEKVGFTVESIANDDVSGVTDAEFLTMETQAHNYAAVVVGMDPCFTYKKLAAASLLLQRGIPFVVTNKDVANRLPSGMLSPEAGSLLVAIESACSREAVNCGKPSPIMVDFVMKKLQIKNAGDVLMIGDRLDTDIEFANVSGFSSALVLSGCTSATQAAEEGNPLRQPTVITQDIYDLVTKFG